MCYVMCQSYSFIGKNIRGNTNLKLKEIRKEKGLSIQRLSNISGVSRRTIEDIEVRGDARVSTMIKLADALEITLDELCR